MPTKQDPPKRTKKPFLSIGFECLLSLTIIFLCVGSIPPGINESHYLPKAKHVWDVSFASGNDIFLQSNDSHFLASLLAGSLAKWFELTVVAWICRVLCWVLFSIAWLRFCRAIELPTILRPLVLLSWLLLVRYGHLAGEWVVGGFEAKSLAYPLALFGLAAVLENRWSIAWIWLGSATAFHPVVGGWIGISAASVWLLTTIHPSQRKSQLTGAAIGFMIALIGIWPALMGLGSPDREGPISAAQVHAYFRLAHHLCPRTFETERWLAAGLVVTLFAGLLVAWYRSSDKSTDSNSASNVHGIQAGLATPMGKLVGIAIVSLLISLIGWTIDRMGVLSGREDLAASLLRFYWFRWSDIAVPLATAMLAGWWLARLSFSPLSNSIQDVTNTGSKLLAIALVGAGIMGVFHWRHESLQVVPPADRWMMQQPGPFAVNWNNMPESGDSILPARYRDWLAVCDWIKLNTPNDSLWITPKHQQSFKWYAQRAEVVSWKDVPQDNRSIIEWYRRIEKLSPPRGSNGKIRSWRTDELIALAKLYHCNWILLDRTYQDKPPLLECKYPINIDNRSFAVFYVSDTVLESTQ